jgi:hypothetical protein
LHLLPPFLFNQTGTEYNLAVIIKEEEEEEVKDPLAQRGITLQPRKKRVSSKLFYHFLYLPVNKISVSGSVGMC